MIVLVAGLAALLPLGKPFGHRGGAPLTRVADLSCSRRCSLRLMLGPLLERPARNEGLIPRGPERLGRATLLDMEAGCAARPLPMGVRCVVSSRLTFSPGSCRYFVTGRRAHRHGRGLTRSSAARHRGVFAVSRGRCPRIAERHPDRATPAPA